MSENKKDVWIGLVEVRPKDLDNSLESLAGGYVNALARANSETEFRSMITMAIQDLGMAVECVEDVERFEDRIQKHEVDPRLRDLAAEAEENDTVLFGTFHTFDYEVH